MDALNRSSLVIRLPADVQTAVGEAQVQIRRKAGADLVRWTPSNELVITLVSLGEIAPSQIAQVMSLTGPIVARYPVPTIVLEGLGGSPSNLQPRFLWIGLQGDIESLSRLDQDLERAVGSVIHAHESRGFQAHLPIGRIKQESESNRSSLGRALRVAGIGNIATFQPTCVELVRASATSMGPTLVTVETFPFAG